MFSEFCFTLMWREKDIIVFVCSG